MKQFKLPENVNPKKVDEEDKMKIKGKMEYDTNVNSLYYTEKYL